MSSVLLPEELLACSPSRRDGVDEPVETTHRIFGCEVVQEAGVKLRLTQVAMVTAQNLLHRFYYRKSLLKFDAFSVAMGSLVLASKVEEQPKLISDFIHVFHGIYQRRRGLVQRPLDSSSPRWNAPYTQPPWWTLVTDEADQLDIITETILSLYRRSKITWVTPLCQPTYLSAQVCAGDEPLVSIERVNVTPFDSRVVSARDTTTTITGFAPAEVASIRGSANEVRHPIDGATESNEPKRSTWRDKSSQVATEDSRVEREKKNESEIIKVNDKSKQDESDVGRNNRSRRSRSRSRSRSPDSRSRRDREREHSRNRQHSRRNRSRSRSNSRGNRHIHHRQR